MSFPEPAKSNSPAPEAPEQNPLLAPVADLLLEWQQRFAANESARRMPADRLSHLRWQLGKEIAQAISERAQSVPKTAFMTELAGFVGCNRSLLYELVDVGLCFSDRLPRHPWTVLAMLARKDDRLRRRFLRKYPQDAHREDLLRFLQSEKASLAPEERDWETDAREAEFRRCAADAPYEALKPIEKALFLGVKLESFDPATIPPSARADTMGVLKQAAETIIAAANAIFDPAPASESPDAVPAEHHVN